jgi:hypothetical protein
MFFNNRAAYKLAEEYALKKQAKEKKKAPASVDATCSKLSVAKSTSTWLSERNENLRAEAIADIQSVITKQNERKEDAMVRIECFVDMGTARLGSNNKRGMYSILRFRALYPFFIQHFSGFANQPLSFHPN